MRTSGSGSEGLLIAVPITVALVFAIIVLGGPAEFLKVIDQTVRAMIDTVSSWF